MDKIVHITFFVGNGFDISCGINSSYKNFYDWYCKQEKSDKAHINAFRDAIEKDINEGKENWADFEEALGQYTQNFTKETVRDFIDCYEDAHANLMRYLDMEMSHFQNDFYDDEIESFREGIANFFDELKPKEKNIFEEIFKLHHNESSSFEFISYNYTDALDRIISVAAEEPLDLWTNANGKKCTLTISPKIIHAHGLLQYHPIFGVNDEQQIINKSLLEVPNFSKLVIKPKCVEELGEYWHDEVNKCISNSSIICIYGMSMGVTDANWFSKIMSWLKTDSNRHIIIFWHNDHPADSRSNWEYLENTRKVKDKIIGFSDYSRLQIEAISNRIHVIENTRHVLLIKPT